MTGEDEMIQRAVRQAAEPVNVGMSAHEATWRDRLRWRLFPQKHCDVPEAPATYQDCIHTEVTAHVSFLERLALMFSGRCCVRVKIVTENIVGGCRTASEFSVLPPSYLEWKRGVSKAIETVTGASQGTKVVAAQYPATVIVHTPSGPTAACDRHAQILRNVMSAVGAHTNMTPAPAGSECINCQNERS